MSARRRLVLSVVAGVLVAVIAAAAVGAESSVVRLRIAPASVKGGETVVIAVAVSPAGALCQGQARLGGGSTLKLAAKRAAAGRAIWTVRPKASPAGKWGVTVTCGSAGSARGSFTVRRSAPPPPVAPPIPARVTVEKAGISARLSSIGSYFAGYGIVLRNVSPDEDALGVTVTVNILDAGGAILKTEADTYAAIPAGTTYYAGGDAILDGQPARLEVRAEVSERQKKSIPGLPTVQNLRVSEDFLGAEVRGDVVNTYTQTLSNLARITFVCFDAAGNAIGGGFTFPDADIPPGGRVGFYDSVDGLPASQIASVRASVEPRVA